MRFGEPETIDDALDIIAEWEKVYNEIYEYIKKKYIGNHRAYAPVDRFVNQLLCGIERIRESANC